jgi:hypothetical protein
MSRKKKKTKEPVTSGYAHQMLNSAFNDYTAARKLLTDPDHIWQGAMLASMTIEKYLKSLLAMKGVSVKSHLTNYHLFEKELKDLNIQLPYELNENFVNALSSSFKFRYFNDIGGTVSCGFFWWQMLAELDEIIHSIDSRINLTKSGKNQATTYQENVLHKSTALHKDNWILNGSKKEDMMLRPGFIAKYVEERILILNFRNLDLSAGHHDFVGATIELGKDRKTIYFNYTHTIDASEKILNNQTLEAHES